MVLTSMKKSKSRKSPIPQSNNLGNVQSDDLDPEIVNDNERGEIWQKFTRYRLGIPELTELD
jgi:hypothetical protein